MAYDKNVYKQLRSLKVPYRLALALANDASPLGNDDGGEIDLSEVVTLLGAQDIAGEKTFKKPPKVETGDDPDFLNHAEIIEEYGYRTPEGYLSPLHDGSSNEGYLMFGWPDVEVPIGSTLKVQVKAVISGQTGAPPALSLWKANSAPAQLAYDSEVPVFDYAGPQTAEQTLEVEVPDFETDRFIVYIMTQYAEVCEVRSVKYFVDGVEQVYVPNVVTIPVLTGIRDVYVASESDLTGEFGYFELGVEHVGKVIVCGDDISYVTFPFGPEVPIGSTIDIISVGLPSDLSLRPQTSTVTNGEGLFLGTVGTIPPDPSHSTMEGTVFGNLKMDKTGGRVTAIKVPTLPYAVADYGPDSWLLTGDYVSDYEPS